MRALAFTSVRRPVLALNSVAFHAYLAGKYLGDRDHWIGRARQEETGTPLRRAYLGFARSAHEAYENSMRRALRLQIRMRSL